MKIRFDPQVFTFQRVGGISRQFGELYRRIPIIFPEHQVRMVPWFGDNEFAKLHGMPQLRLLTDKDFHRKLRLEEEYYRATNKVALSVSPPDIFHPTYYDPYFLDTVERRNIPFVVTVFDMIHEQFADTYFQSDGATRFRKARLVERATRIIAISQSTKDDLVRHLGTSPDKIDVVHLASSLSTVSTEVVEAKQTSAVAKILFVGTRSIYKNFGVFVEALAGLIGRVEFSALCVGGGEFTNEEQQRFRSLGLEGLVRQQAMTDDELRAAYMDASCFVFPSLAEGFGIPLLEAMATGCPVIASNIPVFRELAGDAAVFFDPYSPESLRDRLEWVLGTEDNRKRLGYAGIHQAARYSWDRCAKETVETYLRACNLNGPSSQ